MPFTIEVDRDRRIARGKSTGPYSLEETLAATRAIISHPDLVEGTRLLWDARERETVPGPESVTVWLDTLMNDYGQLDRRIALLTRPGLQYGMARMIEITADVRGFELRVFEDPEEAEAWLLENRA